MDDLNQRCPHRSKSIRTSSLASAQVRMFTLASQNLSGQDMADVFLLAIPEMEKFIDRHPAPFIAKVYRDGLVKKWKDDVSLLAELAKFFDS